MNSFLFSPFFETFPKPCSSAAPNAGSSKGTLRKLREYAACVLKTYRPCLLYTSYPYVTDHEKISDCIDRIVDYAERSLPVLNDSGKLLGIITSADVVELVDDEMGDDYAKLGGLTSEEDLNEGVFQSVKKRLPWLRLLALFTIWIIGNRVGVV